MSYKLAVEGEAIAELPEDERFADIVEEPKYMQKTSLSDPEKKIEKLIMNVKITGKNLAEYFPNLTSARLIANKLKTGLEEEDLKKWVGNRIFWGKIAEQNVGGNIKKVLYVTDVKPTPKKPNEK